VGAAGRQWLGRAERGDGVEHSAAMTDRGDAQLAQILGREPAQYVLVNVVGAEPGYVLLEPKPAQPFGYIHRDRLTTTANRGPL
jgi:hypothetical protein